MVLLTPVAPVAFASYSPRPSRAPKPFHTRGLFQGGDTRNLNLERMDLFKNHEKYRVKHIDKDRHEERLDISFSAGSRKFPSSRIPPYQLRFEPRRPDFEQDRLVLVLQGISGRNVPRLALGRIATSSNVIANIRIHPPLEDGDIAIEFTFKKPIEFRADSDCKRGARGFIRLALRERAPAIQTPELFSEPSPK